MAEHNQLGNNGEELAANYLIKIGYKILEKNWRYQHLEIDLIAEYKNQIIVVEVKTRSSNQWGSPDENVSNTKIKFLSTATEAYLNKLDIDKEVRFDIIAVTFKNDSPSITHLKEAFHPIINQ